MSKIVPGLGAAQAWTNLELGGNTTQQDSVVTVLTTASQILNANPERVGLVFINVSIVNINLGLTSAVAGSNGILLVPSGGSVTMNVRDDFTLVAAAWFATTAGGGSASMYIQEVIRTTVNA